MMAGLLATAPDRLAFSGQVLRTTREMLLRLGAPHDRIDGADPLSTAPVHDSPVSWISAHIDEYVRTGGDTGHLFRGLPTCLLTTVGRKSGHAATVPNPVTPP